MWAVPLVTEILDLKQAPAWGSGWNINRRQGNKRHAKVVPELLINRRNETAERET